MILLFSGGDGIKSKVIAWNDITKTHNYSSEFIAHNIGSDEEFKVKIQGTCYGLANINNLNNNPWEGLTRIEYWGRNNRIICYGLCFYECI